MNIQIETAIENLRTSNRRYAKFERYYSGIHELSFATEKFVNAFGSQFREFAMNLCPAVCDAVKDKLRITGFAVESVDPGFGSRDFRPDVARIWDANRMGLRSGEIHKEALKNGDAFAIVWPDANGRPAIFPNTASQIAVSYDEEMPGRVESAAKFWRTADKRTRLNLYFADRIEKYITAKESEGFLPEASEFVPFAQSSSFSLSSPHAEDHAEASTLNNPYGIVPVFHFANNADLGMPGRSELEDAIPIQDGLNKSVLDMLVAMEYSAYRQRWVAGIEVETGPDGKPIAPFKAGVDHLWIAQDPNSRFGDFETAALDQFLKVKDSFRIDIASVTGTPLHYLMPHMRGQPSGETLKKSETRFLAKVRDRQESFGQVWADLMEFALMIEGHNDVRLKTNWEDPSPSSDRERLENILLKKQIGLSPARALEEAGYPNA
ncbi:MAG: phage portal protein [Acidobacteria bacterium]|nr:phage portal protein [Acidobacteriota bacterium]